MCLESPSIYMLINFQMYILLLSDSDLAWSQGKASKRFWMDQCKLTLSGKTTQSLCSIGKGSLVFSLHMRDRAYILHKLLEAGQELQSVG